MADSIPCCMSAALLTKLHALAERRCTYYLDLYESGRWTRFYSRDEFIAQMNEAADVARRWQQLVDEAERTARVRAASTEIVPLEQIAAPASAPADPGRPWRATISADIANILTAV